MTPAHFKAQEFCTGLKQFASQSHDGRHPGTALFESNNESPPTVPSPAKAAEIDHADQRQRDGEARQRNQDDTEITWNPSFKDRSRDASMQTGHQTGRRDEWETGRMEKRLN
ncbi:MAG: hypothetical protein HQL99_01600 [Magnetococcales bacterium]|nr:hypothetical protein [Magnetococcales bacterium]